MSFTFDMNGFTEIEMMLLSNADAAEKYTEPMLMAGAKVLADAHNDAFRKMAFTNRSTGDLVGSSAPGKVRPLVRGKGYAIAVYPHGNQTHGNERKGNRKIVRNATVAFQIEYGTANMPARPWRDNADAKAADAVQAAMAEIWDNVSYGGGGVDNLDFWGGGWF